MPLLLFINLKSYGFAYAASLAKSDNIGVITVVVDTEQDSGEILGSTIVTSGTACYIFLLCNMETEDLHVPNSSILFFFLVPSNVTSKIQIVLSDLSRLMTKPTK